MVRWTFFLSLSALILLVSASTSFCLNDLYSQTNGYGLLLANTEKTDSQPISDFVSITKQKSPAKAFLFSTVVPGTGELYTGAKRGIAFIATEVVFWSAYVILHGRAVELKDSYTKYVDDHIVFEDDSSIKSTKSWNLEDYEHATQTGNWHYIYTEKDVDRLGQFYWKDLPEDQIDEQGEDIMTPYRSEAYSKRVSSNNKYKQAKICLSLIVVNHVVSAIDARVTAMIHNKRSSQTATNISIHPLAISNDTGAYVELNHRF